MNLEEFVNVNINTVKKLFTFKLSMIRSTKFDATIDFPQVLCYQSIKAKSYRKID